MQYRSVPEQVLQYIDNQYGVQPEFLWAKFPGNAAFRNPGNRKWFAALLLDTPRKTLGLTGDGRVDLLNLKCDPRMAGALVDGQCILPGYHMNKEHWISLLLDGSLPPQEIFPLIDLSYDLISGKTKKKPAAAGQEETPCTKI